MLEHEACIMHVNNWEEAFFFFFHGQVAATLYFYSSSQPTTLSSTSWGCESHHENIRVETTKDPINTKSFSFPGAVGATLLFYIFLHLSSAFLAPKQSFLMRPTSIQVELEILRQINTPTKPKRNNMEDGT